jgi:hypothetical protein
VIWRIIKMYFSREKALGLNPRDFSKPISSDCQRETHLPSNFKIENVQKY